MLPFIRFERHGPHNGPVGFLRDTGVQGFRFRHILHGADGRIHRLGGCQNEIQDGSYRINIRIRPFSGGRGILLQRGIAFFHNGCMTLGLVLHEFPGRPEVNQRDLIPFGDNDIVRRDVPVQNMPPVNIGNGFAYLGHIIDCQIVRQLSLFLDQRLQRDAPDERHHHVRGAVLFKYINDTDYIRMMQSCQDLCFLNEFLLVTFVFFFLYPLHENPFRRAFPYAEPIDEKFLDGIILLQCGMFGIIGDSESPGTDNPFYYIFTPAKAGAGCKFPIFNMFIHTRILTTSSTISPNRLPKR